MIVDYWRVLTFFTLNRTHEHEVKVDNEGSSGNSDIYNIHDISSIEIVMCMSFTLIVFSVLTVRSKWGFIALFVTVSSLRYRLHQFVVLHPFLVGERANTKVPVKSRSIQTQRKLN